jgi:hypothetical protein
MALSPMGELQLVIWGVDTIQTIVKDLLAQFSPTWNSSAITKHFML